MPVADPKNSTNVRNEGLPLPTALVLRLGAALAPEWTAQRAIDRFVTTTRRPPNAVQAAFRASGERLSFDADGTTIVARSWGQGPVVYLLHGWNGSVTDFRHVVPAITRAGFRAVAVDAAGHGESEGHTATAIHLARALTVTAEALGPARAVIAHSLGAAAAAYAAARGHVRAERIVLIAAPAEPADYVDRVAGDVGDDFAQRLLRTLEQRAGVLAADLALGVSARELRQPVVVLHDTEDREARLPPIAEVVAHWPSARLVRTDGLGHRRILAHSAVVAAIVDAVSGTTVRACSHDRVPETCTACALERELYRRDERDAPQ